MHSTRADLYTINPAGDINERVYDPHAEQIKAQYRQMDAMESSGVLMEMAAGTGGTVIMNTNDFDGGFRKLSAPPEFIYMLGFTPAALKSDGSFHALKVTVHSEEKLRYRRAAGTSRRNRAQMRCPPRSRRSKMRCSRGTKSTTSRWNCTRSS